MSNRAPALLFHVLILSAIPGLATTVGGDLTYGGMPVSETFTNMRSGVMQVRSIDQGTTVNYQYPVGDSYQVPVDLEPGEYRLWFLLTPREDETDIGRWSGDLYRAVGLVEIPDQAEHELDVDLQLAVHLVEPLDSLSTWPGSTCGVCPKGAPQPLELSLSWGPVPRAVRYEVLLLRRDCSGGTASETIPVEATKLGVLQGEAPGEEYLEVEVMGYDAEDRQLTVSPYILYSDGCGPYRFTFQPPVEGRSIHSTGQHVAQAAHVGGVGTAFWTSSLILTNPTAADITTALYYTPRGADGLSDYQEATVTVPAGACRVFEDVLGAVFGTTGAGSIEVASSGLVVASRIATAAPDGGAFGQGLMPIASGQVLAVVGKVARTGGVIQGGGSRSNLALNEVWGEPATVTVRLLDRDGVVLGERSYTLNAYANRQVNNLAGELAGLDSLAEGQVEVRLDAGPGRVAATLSLVDSSDDPVTVPVLVIR
jgi:hypothetical protein